MKYAIIDNISRIGTEYLSFFPTKRRIRDKECLGHVRSDSYKWEIALYVDDCDAYDLLDGRRAQDVIIPAPCSLSDFPGWFELSGIPTYTMPQMKVESHEPLERCFSSNILLDKKVENDQIMVRAVKLNPSDSNNGLIKVSSTFFVYTNTWIENLDIQEARANFNLIKERLEQGYKDNCASSVEWFSSFLLSTLKPQRGEGGLLQEAKMKDYCLLSKLWRGITSPSPLRGATYDSLILSPDYSLTWPLAAEMYANEHCPTEYYNFTSFLRKKYDNNYFSSLVNYSKCLMKVADKRFRENDLKRIKSLWRESGLVAPRDLYDEFLASCKSIEED